MDLIVLHPAAVGQGAPRTSQTGSGCRRAGSKRRATLRQPRFRWPKSAGVMPLADVNNVDQRAGRERFALRDRASLDLAYVSPPRLYWRPSFCGWT